MRKFILGKQYKIVALDHHLWESAGWREMNPKAKPTGCVLTMVGWVTAIDKRNVQLSFVKCDPMDDDHVPDFNARWTVPIGSITSAKPMRV